MELLKKKFKLTDNILTLELPEEFANREVEIIIKSEEKTLAQSLLFNEIQIDTKKWKFNRDEIYEDKLTLINPFK